MVGSRKVQGEKERRIKSAKMLRSQETSVSFTNSHYLSDKSVSVYNGRISKTPKDPANPLIRFLFLNLPVSAEPVCPCPLCNLERLIFNFLSHLTVNWIIMML